MQAENLKFKKTLWRENDKEIRAEMDLKMPTTKIARNQFKGMNLMNAQIWTDIDACDVYARYSETSHEREV